MHYIPFFFSSDFRPFLFSFLFPVFFQYMFRPSSPQFFYLILSFLFFSADEYQVMAACAEQVSNNLQHAAEMLEIDRKLSADKVLHHENMLEQKQREFELMRVNSVNSAIIAHGMGNGMGNTVAYNGNNNNNMPLASGPSSSSNNNISSNIGNKTTVKSYNNATIKNANNGGNDDPATHSEHSSDQEISEDDCQDDKGDQEVSCCASSHF